MRIWKHNGTGTIADSYSDCDTGSITNSASITVSDANGNANTCSDSNASSVANGNTEAKPNAYSGSVSDTGSNCDASAVADSNAGCASICSNIASSSEWCNIALDLCGSELGELDACDFVPSLLWNDFDSTALRDYDSFKLRASNFAREDEVLLAY